MKGNQRWFSVNEKKKMMNEGEMMNEK